MTLIAAFRCQGEGILLFADREESDGINKTSIDKIHRLRLHTCEVFIAGAGSTAIVTKAVMGIRQEMEDGYSKGADLQKNHQEIIERSLRSTYKEYVKNDPLSDIGLLIVFAYEDWPNSPMLYKTNRTMLSPVLNYAADGTGVYVANYLSRQLYEPRMNTETLINLAAFILREAEQTTAGVGCGADMVVIHDGNKAFRP